MFAIFRMFVHIDVGNVGSVGSVGSVGTFLKVFYIFFTFQIFIKNASIVNIALLVERKVPTFMITSASTCQHSFVLKCTEDPRKEDMY